VLRRSLPILPRSPGTRTSRSVKSRGRAHRRRRSAGACDALTSFPASAEHGGIDHHHAPRPRRARGANDLDRRGVPRRPTTASSSSGDVTRALIAARGSARIYKSGRRGSCRCSDGLAATMAQLERAITVVCIGLHDDTSRTRGIRRTLVAANCARAHDDDLRQSDVGGSGRTS